MLTAPLVPFIAPIHGLARGIGRAVRLAGVPLAALAKKLGRAWPSEVNR